MWIIMVDHEHPGNYKSAEDAEKDSKGKMYVGENSNITKYQQQQGGKGEIPAFPSDLRSEGFRGEN